VDPETSDTAQSQLDAKIKKLVSAGKDRLQATEEVIRNHPALYKRYGREVRATRTGDED